MPTEKTICIPDQTIVDKMKKLTLKHEREHEQRQLKLKRQPVDKAKVSPSSIKQVPVQVKKLGRNDPCSCGNGQKYKKCCGLVHA
jgi:uncharacterized protein YecA (UPF0149 family)